MSKKTLVTHMTEKMVLTTVKVNVTHPGITSTERKSVPCSLV